MAKATQTYKRSFSGSVGAGMRSVFGGEGRRFYTLVHKVSSRYHKAGESQKIIVDQIELGRDPRCQVRFDDTFGTVSRRHAAIVKDGDNWKLVQLSQTNSTYLNGHKVQKEWYLQNGDEIQLSTNGPKLGFIVPEGNQGLVRSIGLTARLNLFRQQALRPYKQALAGLACLLVICTLAGGYVIFNQNERLTDQGRIIAEGGQRIDDLIAENKKNQEEIAHLQGQLQDLKKTAQTALVRAAEAEKKATAGRTVHGADVDMTKYYPHVYFIKCHKITVNGQTLADAGRDSWLMCGTGFLLDDGKFVTARHVSDPLCYSNDYGFDAEGELVFRQGVDPESVGLWLSLNNMANNGAQVVFHYHAVSTASSFDFTSEDFTCDRSKDRLYTLENGIGFTDDLSLQPGSMIRVGSAGKYDWAFIQTSNRSGLRASREASTKLPARTDLIIVGYPAGRGEGNPVCSEAKCAQNGLDTDGTIMASNNDTEGGNSGGPIFVMDEEGASVVGIVSGSTYNKGRFVPIAVIP